jgi:PKD repeat protein
MPLEPQFRKDIQAKWSYTVADMERRVVAFRDESEGTITSWKWDFGDGSTSTEQNPIHQYKAGREYTTILEVEGPAGKSRHADVWGVAVK